MNESNEDTKRQSEELKGKNIGFYQVMLNAWIQTRMEHDKTLITLSSFAIGLLVTVSAPHSVSDDVLLALHGVAILCFLICIFAALRIYRLNSALIESELRGDPKLKPNLKPYDWTAQTAFGAGALAFGALGIATIIIR
jgi:hypothetical protein